MPTIDDKVVAMSFESSKFETGVARALAVLSGLKKALNLDGVAKSLTGLDASAKKVDLSGLGKGADEASSKLGAMGVAAGVVLGGIIFKALQAGAALAKAFTVAPIIEGFREYETQINAVQTILSNTAAAGTKIKDVNKALDQLNEYSDKTIYNFSEMARNIGTFTAAGVDLQTSVNSIKGIANLAALSGSNSQQAATAMYQLSQAISTGKVSLMDWNSVVNAGMGGTVFQRALAQTAVKMGTLEEGSLKLSGAMKNVKINGDSFRQSLSGGGIDGESWLTSDVLTRTLEQLSGNLTDAELKAQGYTKAQIEAIQTQAKMALEAATTVKTFSQLVSTTKESMSSGWAQTWRLIFGDFGEAKTLFTGASNAIGGLVQRSSDARNNMLKDWKELGGRTLLISSLKSVFQSLGDVLGTVKDAFRDIFPRKTGQDLYNITKSFSNFAKAIKPSVETLDNLKRTFRGLFAFISIVKQLAVGFLSFIGRILGAVAGGSGTILAITAAIGDFFTRIDAGLKKSNAIGKFFDGLGDIIAKPIEMLVQFADAFRSLFSDKIGAGATKGLDGIGNSLGVIGGALEAVGTRWDRFMASFGASGGVFDNLGQSIAHFFQGIATFISEGLAGADLSQVLAVLNTGLFAGLVLAFRNFLQPLGTISDILKHFGGAGALDKLSGVFGSLSGTLGAVQNNIKANTLKQIAIAMILLAGAIFILSTIPAEKMQSAMSALALTFGILLGAMKILDSIATGAGFLKLPIIAAGLIGLGIAIGILTISVKLLSMMSWEELTKGLLGVSVLLGVLAAASGPLAKNSLGLIAAGTGITVLAIALKILASAVKDFGGMSWEELGKGMGAVAAALVTIGVASRLFPSNMAFIGAGLLLVSVSLKIMASAIAQFAAFTWEEIGKGLTVIAGALVAIGVAMKLMPATMALQATGLILVAAALKTLGKAIEQMSGMSWSEIARGLVAMGGALVVLAIGLTAMQGTFTGAASLILAAVGIRILAGALKSLGGQSWGEIIKGLVALAAAIGILAVASLLLGGAVPAMLAMGAALILIGGGLALAGAGIFLIGVGLAAIASSGPVAIAILLTALKDFMEMLPLFVDSMVKALLTLARSLVAAAPEFIKAATKLIIAMSKAIAKAAPAIVDAAVVVISELLTALKGLGPQLVATGFSLLMDLLHGLRDNIAQIVQVAAEIISRFLIGLGQNAAGIIAAGVDLVMGVLSGILGGIGKIAAAAVTLLAKFLGAIALGLVKVVRAGANIIVKFLQGIANNIRRVVTAGANLVIKFLEGIGNNIRRAITSGVNIVIKVIQGIGQNALRLARAAAQVLLDFLNGLKIAIDEYAPQITTACLEIGWAIIAGILQGIQDELWKLWDKLRSIGEKIAEKISDPLDMRSPSKVTAEIGKNIILGLVLGMGQTAPKAYKSAEAMANGVISAVKQVFGINSPSKVMRKLGQYVGDGFHEGLKGTQQSIRNSVLTLNRMLSDAVRNAKAERAKLREEIKKMEAAEKPDTKAIALAQAAVAKNTRLINLASDANKHLIKGLTKERAELSKLAKKYQTLAQELDVAQEKLAEATKIRDDAATGYGEQFSDLPSMIYNPDVANPDDLLGNYKTSLQKQAEDVEKFAKTLEALQALGISDRLYKQLLEEGPAAQQFASQLLAGGAAAVTEINALDGRLETAAKNLGTTAATELYQVGVNGAQAMVDGILSKMGEVEAAMLKIANTIVREIRKKLKIKSPSQVMDKIGKQTAQGLAGGIRKSQGFVANAAESAGTAVIDAMRETMSGLSDILATDIDSEPTITPVLDLDQMKKDTKALQGIFDNVVPISSYLQASAIADQQRKEADQGVEAAQPSVRFEQNNYSPKALTPIEIYRMTKNQLASAKLANG